MFTPKKRGSNVFGNIFGGQSGSPTTPGSSGRATRSQSTAMAGGQVRLPTTPGSSERTTRSQSTAMAEAAARNAIISASKKYVVPGSRQMYSNSSPPASRQGGYGRAGRWGPSNGYEAPRDDPTGSLPTEDHEPVRRSSNRVNKDFDGNGVGTSRGVGTGRRGGQGRGTMQIGGPQRGGLSGGRGSGSGGPRAGRSNTNSGSTHRGGTTILTKTTSTLKALFRRGQIIILPFHVPNARAGAREGDEGITKIGDNLVYSNQRIAIVMWRFGETMTCVPIYSFTNRGIDGVEDKTCHKEYMEITNANTSQGFVKKGLYPVLKAEMALSPLRLDSVVHAAGLFNVNYRETNIRAYQGTVVAESFKRLNDVVDKLIADSRKEN